MSMRRAGVAISLLFGLAAPAYAAEPETPPAAAGGEVKEAGDAEKPGESKGITYWAEVTGASSYVWRGDRLSTGNPSPAIQPEAEVHVPLGPGEAVLNLWMNHALTGDSAGTPNSRFELDPFLSYTLPISAVSLRLGYIAYLYLDAQAPEPIDNQHEFSVLARLEEGLPVKPFVAVHVDPIRYKGFYSCAGVVHNISFMNDKLSFETTFNVGVSSYQGYGGTPFGLQDITLFSRGEYLLTDLIYVGLTLGVAYSGRAGTTGGDQLLPYALLAVGLGN